MNKVNKTADSLEEVIASADAAYDKHKKETPHLYPEDKRCHFVRGWLEHAYEELYKVATSIKEHYE